MRPPIRRRHAALALLSAGILITAGCGSDEADEEEKAKASRDVFLEAVAARGLAPFTRSTAVAAPPTRRLAGSGTSGTSGTSGGTAGPAVTTQTLRSVSGATAGLYGGTKAAPSCDVEAQIRLLTADSDRADAFARGVGISRTSVPAFLRALTPVVLRADARVTNHGYRDGSPAAYQAVLQTGTAVLVDDRGLPRVRCAGGSPLRPAVALRGPAVHKGTPWSGYRPERVVVISGSTKSVSGLTIVDVADNTWFERGIGTDGDQDRTPDVLPPYGPNTDIVNPSVERSVPDGAGSGPGPDSFDRGGAAPDDAGAGSGDSRGTDEASAPLTPDEPLTDEPLIDESLSDEPLIDEYFTDEPLTDESFIDEPWIDEPFTDELLLDEPLPGDPESQGSGLGPGLEPEESAPEPDDGFAPTVPDADSADPDTFQG